MTGLKITNFLWNIHEVKMKEENGGVRDLKNKYR